MRILKLHNLLRVIFFTAMFLFTNAASATLVSIANYTQSSSTGLDWLDLTETVGLDITSALARNNGWRQAERTELNDLFELEFGTAQNIISASGLFVALDIPPARGFQFMGFFGKTSDRSSLGYYNSDLNLDLATPFSYLCISTGACNPNSFTTVASIGQTPTAGQFLVRDTSVVPVPAAVWLFASGLIGLFGFSRKTLGHEAT